MRLLVHVQELRCGEGQHLASAHRPLTPVSLCKVPHGAKGPWGQSLSSVLSRSGPVPLPLPLLCSLKEGAAVPGAAGTLASGGWNGDWRKRGAESPVWKSTEGQGSIEARESQDLGPRLQPRAPAPLHGHQHWTKCGPVLGPWDVLTLQTGKLRCRGAESLAPKCSGRIRTPGATA